jgi:hypothetical protein
MIGVDAGAAVAGIRSTSLNVSRRWVSGGVTDGYTAERLQ